MPSRARLLTVLAAALLGLVFVFPLWQISLEAPQYPEGIGMLIHVDTITGVRPHDLRNINGLNHYIGMKEIVPSSIPELSMMPWLLGGLLVLALVAAAVGRPWLLYLWVGTFALLALAGLVDFYLWAYDYGHNLDPSASIKIPGMSYQPPLIGSKKLLNFTAHSWPALGGWAAFASLALGGWSAVLTYRRRPEQPAARPVVGTVLQPVVIALLVVLPAVLPMLLTGCTPAPRPLHYGDEACTHCMMPLSDARYGAELVTATGKVYPFDSIECMKAHLSDTERPEVTIHSLWLADYQSPGTLLRAEAAWLVQSPHLHSPMGGALAAVSGDLDPDTVAQDFDGEVFRWADFQQGPAGHLVRPVEGH